MTTVLSDLANAEVTWRRAKDNPRMFLSNVISHILKGPHSARVKSGSIDVIFSQLKKGAL